MSYFPNNLEKLPIIDLEKLDAVFLDLDDTIVDYRNSCIVGLAQVRKVVPALSSVDVGTMEQEFREILRDNLPRLFDGELTVEEERKSRMNEILSRHQVDVSQETLERCDNAFLDGFWNARSVMDGADSILELFRSIDLPVVIITNGNFEMQKRTLEMLDLDKNVHSLLAPTNSLEMKPNPGLFEKAISITGADKSRSIMIGDTWQHDILGAINAGITPVWINRRMVSRPDDLDVLEIKSLQDLFHFNNRS